MRAEELIDLFLQKLQSEKPERVDQIEDPDVQYALFTAQKEYARSGEKEMEDMLVNILLERIDENTQSLKKIVLNEALEVIPKLTNQQLDILTLIFLIQETKNHAINNIEALDNYLRTRFVPFLDNLTKEQSCYKHLEFTGCCGPFGGFVEDNLSGIFVHRYRGVFSKGFKKDAFTSITEDSVELDALLIPCLNDKSLFQFNALTEEILRKKVVETFGQTEKEANQFIELFKNSTMTIDEANDFLISVLPEMRELIDTWKDSYMCAMNPTSVGIVLAYINLKRKTGIKLNLDIWIK